MAHEDRKIIAVAAPSMNWAVTLINDDECAHLLLYIVPHEKPGYYWLIFKADSWVREKFKALAEHGQVIE